MPAWREGKKASSVSVSMSVTGGVERRQYLAELSVPSWRCWVSNTTATAFLSEPSVSTIVYDRVGIS